MTNALILWVVLLPLLGGGLLALLPEGRKRLLHGVVLGVLVLEAVAVTALLFVPDTGFYLFSMTDSLHVNVRLDGISRLFLAVAAYAFLASAIYAFRYLDHSERQKSFFCFYLLSLGALAGMDEAGNLITMYLFFEMVTLCSVPLVLHDRTEESIRGALKYLFYSIAGAFLALLAIFFLNKYGTSLDFQPGGVLDPTRVRGHESTLRVIFFFSVVGFGAKAGLYPLHGWLPTAHPVAPAPASAVLSGVIAKAGVFTILRLIYNCIGPDFLRGTWVQTALLGLSLLTVFMGSMMAYREKILKKRLAYSSVSQISYILTGLFLLSPVGVQGGLLHVIFHACIKVGLFMTAGAFLHCLGLHRVDELRGVGRAMPKILWAFTLSALALVGIPPASGFISKWYLAQGALDSGLPVFAWLVPVVLLISALLTAGYLLPVAIDGFFPGKECKAFSVRNDEGGAGMWAPILVLGVAAILMGLCSGDLCDWAAAAAESLF